jgi:large subunit ribosomal protein L23
MADAKKPAPKKAAKKQAPAKPVRAPRRDPNAPTLMASGRAGGQNVVPRQAIKDPYDVVIHPVVTEKTMFNMDNNNTLEFLVAIEANKPQILKAIEELFTVKVAKVTTRITKDGKRAVVKFAEGYSAEDIGTRIGVF